MKISKNTLSKYWKNNENKFKRIVNEMDFRPCGVWYTDAEYWNSNYNTALYIGENAVREYKAYLLKASPQLNQNLIQGIPVENDGGAGTQGGHLEEGDNNVYNTEGDRNTPRYFDGIEHAGLDYELMTGWSENSQIPEPLSKITIGMMEDLGYTVDYSKADAFVITTI